MPMNTMPTDELVNDHNYRSKFTHDGEIAVPGLYEVTLPDLAVRARLTAGGTHSGVHEYTWSVSDTTPSSSRQVLLFDMCHSTMPDNAKACKQAIANVTKLSNGLIFVDGSITFGGALSGRHPKGGVRMHFFAEISAQLLSSAGDRASPRTAANLGKWVNKVSSVVPAGNGTASIGDSTTSGSLGLFVDFGPLSSSVCAAVGGGSSCSARANVRAGISWISSANARQNLRAQAGDAPFSELVKRAQSAWRVMLDDKIDVQFPKDFQEKSEMVQFATALYHVFMAPSTFSEADGTYLGPDDVVRTWPYKASSSSLHGGNGTVSRAMTDMSIWDTFRTVHPLMNILDPHANRDCVRSLYEMAAVGGDIEKWPLANVFTSCMIGDHAFNVIADFADKKVFNTANADEADKKLIADLYPYMYAKATTKRQHSSRADVDFYSQHGYVPLESDREAASLTLSYAMDDHSVATVAKYLGKGDDHERMMAQSLNYKNVWNNQSQFMCPKKRDGTIICPDDWQLAVPYIAQNPEYYVEGDAWQWMWFVQHDAAGLVNLFPSPKAFVDKLETFITKSKGWAAGNTIPNPYYWAGNEPDMQAAWMFSYAGRFDLTQKYTKWIAQEYYSDKWDGLPGNDDYGALSAWLVWTKLGLYPMPATGHYVLGSPTVEKATLRLPYLYRSGFRSVTISYKDLDGIGKLGAYAACATVNGKKLASPFVQHAELFSDNFTNDMVLEFATTNAAPKAWCEGL